MNKISPLLTLLFITAFACLVRADVFVSQTIAPQTNFTFSHLHAGQFLVIKNFTQDDLTGERGYVSVTKPPGTSVMVLTAAALDASPPDIINTVVIAGPADVTAHCGDTTGNCFISYRKDSN